LNFGPLFQLAFILNLGYLPMVGGPPRLRGGDVFEKRDSSPSAQAAAAAKNLQHR